MSGARAINVDRMWHYTEGLRNRNPIWPRHGIRIVPGPSSRWLDPTGRRLPYPNIPGADTLGTLQHITSNGVPYTWLHLNRAIIKKEFVLSGSEQNPDLTGKSIRMTLERIGTACRRPYRHSWTMAPSSAANHRSRGRQPEPVRNEVICVDPSTGQRKMQ